MEFAIRHITIAASKDPLTKCAVKSRSFTPRRFSISKGKEKPCYYEINVVNKMANILNKEPFLYVPEIKVVPLIKSL